MNSAESEEHARLQACLDAINSNVQGIRLRLNDYAKDIKETKEHMWEARRDLDHIDKAALRQMMEQKTRSAEILNEQQQKLLKLAKSPYFGRFDFSRDDAPDQGSMPVYIGVHDFHDEENGRAFVYDWRAPISSMFYDHEIGPARYEAPSGEVSGRLELKRQFRIREGNLEFLLESAVNIVDDVLQQELSRASDAGMKNIVATIQRDQNAIIRDGEAHTLIIQGVAGSGKTSIALHRIAFLLYRFKETLSSSDILILSPNRVFADYIGNVLPELGEEQVGEIGIETLANELLDGKYRFQTFFEQTSDLLEFDDAALKERITVKASPAFLRQIDAYIEHLEAGSFEAMEWRSGLSIVPDWHFAEAWKKYRKLPVKERIAEVISMTEHRFFIHYKRELRTEERRDLRKAVRAMVRSSTLRAAYKGLFDWMERPELLRMDNGKFEHADIFPLIYLKMQTEGIENPRKDIKHLLIDEMQDYTPLQYMVLGKLFPCRKTILGDATQSVNPCGTSTATQIQEVLRAPVPVKLTKSYRSTWEIMQFALGISPNTELDAMKRHGEPPRIILCNKPRQIIAQILSEIEAFNASSHRTLAIIAKTQKQAGIIHRQLLEAGVKAGLLDPGAGGFSTGVVVCTAYLAKGLEFDRVIIPDADDETYRTDIDRNLLYVACTRAMHYLMLIAREKVSGLLPVGAPVESFKD